MQSLLPQHDQVAARLQRDKSSPAVSTNKNMIQKMPATEASLTGVLERARSWGMLAY